MAPWIFTVLTKPKLFLCHHKGLCVIIYLDDILVLTHSKHAGKRAQPFLCSLLICLVLHINLAKSDLHLTQCFPFLGPCLNTVDISDSLSSDKLTEGKLLAQALLQRQPVTACQVSGKGHLLCQ